MSGPIQCQSDDPNLAGVAGGNSSTGNGVYGWSQGTDGVRGVGIRQGFFLTTAIFTGASKTRSEVEEVGFREHEQK